MNTNRFVDVNLVAAWAAFVFIPFDLFAGVIISRSVNGTDAALGIGVGIFFLCMITIPAVIYASKTGHGYVDAINSQVGNAHVRKLMGAILPLVNIGWFSVQTIAAVDIITPNEWPTYIRMGLSGAFSLLFMFGATFWGYNWINRLGKIGIIAMATGISITIFSSNAREVAWGVPNAANMMNASMLVLGTWVFSSTTCVMDIAKEVRSPKIAVLSVLLGTLIADLPLITTGFLYPGISGNLATGNFVGWMKIASMAFVFIAIWTTNDTNFYSTRISLARFGIGSKWAVTIVIFATIAISGMVGSDIFSWFGRWLNFMGWIGIPMGIFWAIQCSRIQHDIR